MKKIKINLNPKKPAAFEQGFGKILDYTPLLILLVIALGLIIGAVAIFSGIKARQYSNYQKIWQEWKPKNNELVNVKRKISGLKKTSEKIKEVMLPDNTGKDLLKSLFAALSENIWFKKVQFENDKVDIEGYVLEWEKNPLVSLENFINQLQADQYFSKKFTNIDIKDTKSITFNGQEATQFIIECRK